jgi:hypothetical protein
MDSRIATTADGRIVPFRYEGSVENMTIAASIKEMPDRPFNDSIENRARRILKELPHLKAKDIAQVATELVADAEAATQIAEIIKNAALQILRRRAGQGDELARELFQKLYEAVGAHVYADDEPVGHVSKN